LDKRRLVWKFRDILWNVGEEIQRIRWVDEE